MVTLSYKTSERATFQSRKSSPSVLKELSMPDNLEDFTDLHQVDE